ncbi:hypothetical protein KAFR_0I01950 [Kazachstania africana CBS 2517]|uniref:BAR domain-containing protein n=1 Tax=Kazachstania africana (strain ATCC 22294 / BCRC 22015 / CBS 2517 / CECT 1963 / NBRC 1671 / NRRL Y-8276) TaxID=1071382 RepID=H2B025_KAZAF|nr:hypothetical protein KAFR_0I01950 [Kazachstania africana CBS 2517]CCF59975.1 hypothetical protein KAFR_0I01950 [Kazachstania africana CBS 2517]
MSSFNEFTNSFTKRFQELSTSVSQRTQELSNNLPTLAQSTQRLVQEKLGQVTDISQLPQEYLELEKKVDSIKLIHEHFLQVTSIYENESYDYPKVIKDSVNDFSKTMAAKITDLSHASSASEAQNILISPGPIRDPKTLNYALSKVSLTASEVINQVGSTPNESALSSKLLEFSNVQSKIAQARLQQDTLIQTKFNKALRDDLSTSLAKANKFRKEVQNKRLQYDVARTNLMNAKPEKEASLRVKMESLEDEFAQATENATLVMQEVIAGSDFLTSLNQMVAAQLEYFQTSAQLLQEFTENNAAPTDASSGKAKTESKSNVPIVLSEDEE